MTSLSRPRVEFISTILQTVLNLGLLCLGLILVVFLGKETVHLADVLFAPEQTSKYELVEGLVVYFLYFEFKTAEAGVKSQHAEMARRAGQEDYSVAVCCVFFVSGSQSASSSSRVLPLVSGTNFHINSAARTPIQP